MPVAARRIHAAFEISLIAKAAFAVLEAVGGVAAYFVPQSVILHVVERIAREELLEDRRDLVANHLIGWAQGLSVGTRHFTAVYLLSHGLIKLWLIVGLLRGKASYYPLAMAIFGAFIAYQLYRFNLTHSIWLVVITVIDVAVIVLTWLEYQYVRRRLHATDRT